MSTEPKAWIGVQPGYNGMLLMPIDVFHKLAENFHVLNETWDSKANASVAKIDETAPTLKMYNNDQLNLIRVKSKLMAETPEPTDGSA